MALSPIQCVALQNRYPNAKILVESSPSRAFSDQQYRELGIEVTDDLQGAEIIFNIKELPADDLIPGKTYFFFSHTIKKQPYNREMLKSILTKNITLIDYEILHFENGQRVLGFGRYAGIVGTYNGLLAYGKKHGLFSLKPAHQSTNYTSILTQLLQIKLPNMRILVSGGGRVSQGSLDILRALQLREVSPGQFLHIQYNEPIFVQLNSPELYIHPSQNSWNTKHFYSHHKEYKSQFSTYLSHTDLLINGIYWTADLPRLFEKSDTASTQFRPTVIADISCDIDGSVPITYKSTSIENPVMGWSRSNQLPCEPYSMDSIDIMAVGNLPNELPRDASEEFGEMLLQSVIPALFEKKSRLLLNATICKEGKLTKKYNYLSDYVQ